MSAAEGEETYMVGEDLAISESGELLTVDDQIIRTISLEVGGWISFRGWQTKQMVV